MNKLFTVLLAAIFAAFSFTAVAAETPSGGDTPKAESKKSDKPAKKSKSKKSKKAKSKE
ncbi:MAG: hypothetical protein JWN94_2769 [Betaproteobacteria bacterium]|jgi:hypothetical protein|nr:hypothetical protein [Betaproteobacteria bacterium]